MDGENGHAIMRLLAGVARDSAHAVLVVTHDPRILPFARRVVRIEDGRIVGEQRKGAEYDGKGEDDRVVHGHAKK